MTEDFVGEALHRAAELLPDTPDRASGVRRKRASIVRRRFTSLAVVLVVVGVGTGFVVTRGSGAPKVVLPATSDVQLMATGRVVQVPGRPARFCAPEFHDGALRFPTPPPQWCALGVNVLGVDFMTLENRREAEGAVEGYATLQGHLDGEVLVVTDQGPVPEGPGVTSSYGAYPGCPEPAGGWDQHPVTYDPPVGPMDSYYSLHRAEVAFISVGRPDAHTAFPYLLTWGDPSATESAMQVAYGDQQCVVQSRWTKEQVAEARDDLASVARDNDVYGYSTSGREGPDGQLEFEGSAVRETPGLKALIARHPKGLVRLIYWLHPVS